MMPSQVTLAALSLIGSLAIPFLLFGNFARILNNRYAYKRLIMVHGLASLAIIALFFFIFFRYILGLAPVLSMSRVEFTEILRHFVSNHFRGRVFAFNIFIDLFLCTMFMFFLTYEPKHIFTGKRKLIFRLLSILPLLYEATSIVLKFLERFCFCSHSVSDRRSGGSCPSYDPGRHRSGKPCSLYGSCCFGLHNPGINTPRFGRIHSADTFSSANAAVFIQQNS